MLTGQLCRNGDLYHYLRTVEEPSIPEQLDLMLDASRGCEFLHAREPAVVHRDIKSLNIARLLLPARLTPQLITSKGRAKLADFGLARVKTSANSLCRTSLGTLNCARTRVIGADLARASARALGSKACLCVVIPISRR